ncbi:Peroxiredoxin [Spirosomataceae bacterium TFI 002]|nr:Peroxiredoxin [Spirosomataceae bacterium TFI 002]
METKKESLEELLANQRIASTKKYSEERNQINAAGVADVRNSGILSKTLNVGDIAPDFTLRNVQNQPVSLYNELANGPVILVWYRGGWCPYCNITLHYLQEKLPEFKEAGATLIALTPELPDNSLSTTEKNNIAFNVLSDLGNKVGKEFGVVFELTAEIASIYEASFGLNNTNGDDSNELPLAATYVIDTDKTIKYAFLDADHKKRAEPEEILKALKAIK